GNRLPLGEVQFVIPDFLYLGMMTLILRIVGQISPWYAPITMLGSFAIFMMYPQYKLGYLFDIFISTMLLGTIPLVHQRPETVFIFSLAAYVMNVVSLRKSLKSLHHWKFGDNLMLKIGKDAKDHLENLKNDKSILGWPWEIMSPAIQNRIDQKSLSLPQAAYMSIAITYLFWATSIGAKTEAILFSPFFLIVLAAAQLEQRIGLRTPPNNLLSRFTTGKLIIKGYDQILITPILFFLILIPYFHLIFSLSQILSMRGPQPSVTLHICAIAGVFFLLLLLALAGPPTNARWILTGKYNPQAKTLFSNRVKYKECR
ncbi:MAG: hypothetical protein KDA65_06790, partial [Planctomycetaceae bacterium]|nr:hypothetical protein [Planctomycetaceae bacterium]